MRKLKYFVYALFIVTMFGQPAAAEDIVPVSDDFKVNTYTNSDQKNGVVGVSSNLSFVVAWVDKGQQGIYAQRFSRNGDPLGLEFPVTQDITSYYDSPSIAMAPDGRFVVSWHTMHSDGTSYNIVARLYKSDGSPVTDEFRVNDIYINNFQKNPSVAMNVDGSFIVAWENWLSPKGIYARRYNALGVPLDDEFKVNIDAVDFAGQPSVAISLTGDFVIAWNGNHGGNFEIDAVMFDKNGDVLGDEFRLNTVTTNNQLSPDVAVSIDGTFIVAWSSLYQDDYGYGVYARRFKAYDDFIDGVEFLVNTAEGFNQRTPTVAFAADNTFTIAWESYDNQDCNGQGVFARRFKADGEPQTAEFQLSQHCINHQFSVDIGSAPDGSFIATWTDSAADGSGYGVYARQYGYACGS